MSQNTDLLTLLTPEQRRALLARCERRVFQPGGVLIRQSSTPRSLFRVHSGFARVHREQCGSRVELARMQPGSWFGELSFIDGSPALATVTAESRIEVDQLTDEALQGFLTEAPDTAVALYKALSLVLSLRLRTLTEAIPERLFDDGPTDVSMLKADGLVSYLAPTQFCDFEHPSIQALAAELAAGCTDPSEIARRAFYWVRDGIKYTLGLTPNRASDTLAERQGSCSHKAILFVAMMRSLGIPAGYHFMFVRTREYLGPTNTPRFSQFMSIRSLHVLPAALLRDRWVRCDPTDDARLSNQLAHLNPAAQLVDFDGALDAMLNLPVHSVEYYDATCWPSVDAILSRAPRISPVVVDVFNRYLDFIREFGLEYASANSVSDGFLEWL